MAHLTAKRGNMNPLLYSSRSLALQLTKSSCAFNRHNLPARLAHLPSIASLTSFFNKNCGDPTTSFPAMMTSSGSTQYSAFSSFQNLPMMVGGKYHIFQRAQGQDQHRRLGMQVILPSWLRLLAVKHIKCRNAVH